MRSWYDCPRAMVAMGAILSVILFSGCGGQRTSPNLTQVSGTVTFDGKPLPAGMIVFEPDPVKGNRGQQGYADIKDGRFDTRTSGKGVSPGAQIIHITGGDGMNPEPTTPFGNSLFEEYIARQDVSKDQPTLQFDVPRPKQKRK